MRMRSLLAVLVVPALLPAQHEPLRQPASVPFDLAAALASAGGLGPGGNPQILVGELPEWMASRVAIPAGAVILGSALQGTMVVGIVQTLEGAFHWEDFEREMTRRGWKKADAMRGASGGFRFPAPASPRIGMPFIFCSDDRMLFVSPGAARQGRHTWVLRFSPPPQSYSPCSPPASGGLSALPTLYHPADATRDDLRRMSRDCSATDASSLGASNGTGDRIRASTSPDSLLAHYARQLADSGWTPVDSRIASIGGYWSKTDASGKKQMVHLTIGSATDNPACRDLSIMLYGGER